MTRTTPLRLMILHLSQRGLIDAWTFIGTTPTGGRIRSGQTESILAHA